MTVPECRHLLCDLEADFLVTVNRAGASKTARYCTKHLTRVTEAIDKAEGATLTRVRPIKESTVTNENPGPYPGPPLTANEEIANLEHDKSEMKAAIRTRDERIAAVEEDNTNLEHVIADLRRDVRAADEAIDRLKNTNNRLAEEIGGLRSIQDALVSSLHVLADNAEDEGRQDLAEEVDALLAEHDLKPRKQEYTIEILVPTKLHVHVTARSMNHARTLYEAGDVDWNVADGEVQDDDIEFLGISEGSL